jgi:hypothetical protein
MKLFRAYLQELPPERLPSELEGTDLATFHYGSWLLERGYDFKANRETTPLYWDYIRFQRKTIVGYFAELSDYIKEYGRSKGRDVLVSGNFYYFTPHYYAFEPKVDILITEMDSTSYRQPSWCRYAAGFAQDKPVIVVENPYGGVPPELLPKLKDGKAHDLFRMMQYEAAALGINMSVPYGAWMGSVIEDSFWAPHDVVVEIQDFITEHEELYSTRSFSETAVVHSVQSAFDWVERNGSRGKFPFWGVCDGLVEQKQPFDVIVFPEGELRADSITPDDLAQYRTLVLPECGFLTLAQAGAVREFLDKGGRVLVTGDIASNLDEDTRRGLLSHPQLMRTTSVLADDFGNGAQVMIDGDAPDLAINIHRVGDKQAAIHLIRYDYDEERDEVPILPSLTVDVRLGRPFRMAKSFTPRGEMGTRLTYRRDVREMHRLELQDVPLYSVILLQG